MKNWQEGMPCKLKRNEKKIIELDHGKFVSILRAPFFLLQHGTLLRKWEFNKHYVTNCIKVR